MDVLVVSQYYPPEPGATQNRLGAFVGGLAARGHHVTVVCEQPCHPSGVFQRGYGRRPLVVERGGNITVQRLWVAASPLKTTTRRLAFYVSFSLAAAAATLAAPRHDVVFASSPPLPGVLAAAAAARLRGMPLVVDVRDIWPAAAEALGELTNPQLMRALRRAEAWLYRTARRVTTTTRPFCAHVDRVAGRALAVHIPNGALDELLALPERTPANRRDFVVGYAGNLGIAQGLGIVIDAAELLREEPVRFVLVGDGPDAPALREKRDLLGLENVEIRGPVPVEQIGSFLQSCNALLVPLRNHPLLSDFMPSKLYDAMAVGRPAIVAAAGEAASVASETGSGLVVPPEDGGALAEAVRALKGNPAEAHRLGAAGRAAAAAMARSGQLERLEEVLREAANRVVRTAAGESAG